MRLGVDCRSLTKGPNGIARYLSRILHALTNTISDDLEIVLFSPGKILSIYGEFGNLNARVVDSPSIKNRYLRQIWSELYLPIVVLRYKIDCMWFPANRIPVLFPKNIGTILTVHDLVWKSNPRTMRFSTWVLDSVFMKRSIKVASCIFTVSEEVSIQIENCFNLEKKIKVISPSPGFDSVDKTLCSSITDKGFMLFVGSFEPRKNLKRILKAYSNLDNHIRKKVKFVCVGFDEWKVDIRQIVKELSIESDVVIRKGIEDEVLACLYSKSLFLVMPSLQEGFGMPLIESMHFGTPVITSNVPPMKDIVSEAGILVNPLSVDSINQGMRALLEDDDLRLSMSVHAKERSKFYSSEKSVRDFIKLLEVCV